MSTSGERSAACGRGVPPLCLADRHSEAGSSRPDAEPLLQILDDELPGPRKKDDGRVRA